jgi:hypothetical protein
MDLATQTALTIAAAAGLWAWIIAGWITGPLAPYGEGPVGWFAALYSQTERQRLRWRLEASLACGISACVAALLAVT